MRSVTEQLALEHGLDNALDVGGEPGAFKAFVDEGIAAATLEATKGSPVGHVPSNQLNGERMATAKLRVAYATRGSVAKATGVRLVSPGHDQVQEIFDDGSARNPYKVNRALSGRQRRKMRKTANAAMKARGVPGRIENALKGRRVGKPERPQSETTESPAPTPAAPVPIGTRDATRVGD